MMTPSSSPSTTTTTAATPLYATPAANRLGGVAAKPLPKLLKVNGFVKKLDYQKLLTTPRGQSHFIYVAMILSRLVAAGVRGAQIDNYREVYEHALRDTIGFTMFFFGSNFLLRFFTKAIFPNTWNQLMTAPQADTIKRPFMGKAIGDSGSRVAKVVRGVRRWKYALVNSDLLSSSQVKELGDKRLAQLRAGGHVSTAKIENLAKEFKRMVTKRNAMSTLGLVVNIALLGIGIPLLNIVMTKNSVKAHKGGTGKDAFPQIRRGLNPQVSPYGADYQHHSPYNAQA